jgi:rare lipoprotein A
VIRTIAALAGAVALLAGCSSAPKPKTVTAGYSERGIASWYGGKFHGRATASGEIYDMHEMTAAHKTLPLGSVVDVKNLDNGRKVRVKVNDRGPFVKGRIIDLSFAAAQEIGMVGPGTAHVRLEVVSTPASGGDAAAAPPLDRKTRWLVQAGAFRDYERARAAWRDLSYDFAEVRVRTVDGLHRVEVGRWKKRKKAEKAAKKIGRLGYEPLIKATSPPG